jgi:hypothetical protein
MSHPNNDAVVGSIAQLTNDGAAFRMVAVQNEWGSYSLKMPDKPAEPAKVLDSRCAVTRFDIVPSEKNRDRCILPAGHAWLHDFEPADHASEGSL